jgi:asparagine synthase (glutamine-hydrolysing)
MCGIAGIITWSKNNSNFIKRLEGMCDLMIHRGPDGYGYAVSRVEAHDIYNKLYKIKNEEKGVFLGHRRLSILDLSVVANQPMVNNDGSLIIVFNGEIYNYIELRDVLKDDYVFHTNSDTEVLLAAYQKWGVDMLSKLDGMFGLAIYDNRKRTLFAARDAVGIKPFYYSKTDTEFIFGSEPKVVLKGSGEQGRLDMEHASEFFILGVSDHDEGTFIKQVNQLKGGHYLNLNIDNGDITIRQYWSSKRDLREARESDFAEYLNVARQAISRQLRSDVPLGSSLSGGIDSSTIVTLAGEILGSNAKNYKALTFTFPDFEDDESAFAKMISKNSGIEWFGVTPPIESFSADLKQMITNMGEPFSTLSMFAQYKVMEKASQLGLKVMLDGQGGDELYLGYERMAQRVFMDYFRKGDIGNGFKEWVGAKNNMSLPLWKSFVMNLYFDSQILKTNRRKKTYSKYVNTDVLNAYRADVASDIFANKAVQDKQADELSKYCLPRLLRFADRNSMAFSVEQRVPHLSNLLLDFALELPLERRVNNGWSKFIVRKSMEGKIPAAVLWNPKKRGFDIPQGFWVEQIADQLKEWIGDSCDLHLFKRDNIIKDLYSHDKGSPSLWTVVSTILFMEFSKIKA